MSINMKAWSTSLLIREIKFKPINIPIRPVILQNLIIPGIKNLVQLELLSTTDENVNWLNYFGD